MKGKVRLVLRTLEGNKLYGRILDSPYEDPSLMGTDINKINLSKEIPGLTAKYTKISPLVQKLFKAFIKSSKAIGPIGEVFQNLFPSKEDEWLEKERANAWNFNYGKSSPIKPLMIKKGGLLIKAEEGTKLNFWLKTGNFINSDLGKGLLNMVAGGLSTINNSVKATNYTNEFDEATEAQVKAMLQLVYSEKYKEGLLLAPMILLSDGNVNYSNIDYLLFAKLYAEGNSDLSSIAKFKMDRLKEKLELINAIQGSSSGFGDMFSNLAGQLGLYLEKQNSKTPSITEPMKNYAVDFKQKANSSINDMNFKVAMAMKDPTYRLPNYTLSSLDYKFSWQK